MFFIVLLQCWFFLVFGPTGAQGHPQCLDYLPPFRSARPELFCKETAAYGCCTTSRDGNLKNYYEFVERFGKKIGANDKCFGFMKKIVCAECHPYAAHIFDAEDPPAIKTNFSKNAVRFPGLCYDFCMAAFADCRELILQLPLNHDFRSYISTASDKEFCEWAIPGDIDYCYPTVKGGRMADDDMGKRKQFGDDVLCVQPIAQQLSNPLAGVSANDGTHRLFIAEQRGVVFVLDSNGQLIKNRPFLDIRDKVLNSGQGWDERGLLGLAFHPEFARNGRFFVYYSTAGEES